MRITFDANGKIQVEGQAAFRYADDIADEKINDGQTWHITTKAGNTLVLPAVEGETKHSFGFRPCWRH